MSSLSIPHQTFPSEATLNVTHTILPALLLFPIVTHSQAIPVRHTEGRSRGFVVLRDQAGRQIGYGQMSQEATGDRVEYHMVYHFRDGSLDEETAVFSQRGTFQLVSDRHIQRGPFFSTPLDLTAQANGQMTSRVIDKSGTAKDEVSHVDLEPGTAVDGMLSTLMANVDPARPPFKLPMLSPTAKPRLFHFAISAAGHGTFRVAGVRMTAAIFRAHTELGGLTGIVAPLLGKQPKDFFAWVVEGDAPAVVRVIAQISEGSPLVDIQVAGATFPPLTRK